VTHFTFYSRSYCHLCVDMLHALRALQAEFSFAVEVVDVDADPALVAVYDELVPVLIGAREGFPPQQLCHYFLNENAVREFLSMAPS
jgi:thiol-disulfide isomerase/thioredoxin